MIEDLKLYTKYYSGKTDLELEKRFITCKNVFDPTVLENTKILVDTSYYGWLVIYRKMVDYYYNVDWSFALEIHKRLGNRPIMFNDQKEIGGHCVIPNLKLLGKENIIADLITEGSLFIGKNKKRSGDAGGAIVSRAEKFLKRHPKINRLFDFTNYFIIWGIGFYLGIWLGVNFYD